MTVESKIIEEKARQIAEINDRVRKDLSCRLVLSYSVSAMLENSPETCQLLLERVKAHKEFSAGNDPYREHDFGAFDFEGLKYFWKFDYYNQDMTEWHDPLSPLCNRVLTIMEASEY